MSKDKRKKFDRACAFLRRVNNGDYPLGGLSGRYLKNPIIRYVVRRGMARIKRVDVGGGARRTLLDTGVSWARPERRSYFRSRSIET